MSDILYASCSSIMGKAPHLSMAGVWLSRRGWDVTIVCPLSGKPGRIATELGEVNVDPILPGGRLQTHWQLFWRLLRHRIAGAKLFYIQSNPACVSAYFALWGLNRQRMIYHTQDLLDPRKFRVMEFFERAIARRAGFVISNEPARARFLASYYHLRQMPLIVRTALPRDWPEISDDPDKRQSLLAGFPSLAAGGGEDVRLIAAGGGFSPVRCSEQLMQALAHLPPRYRLIFTSMQPQTRAWREGQRLAESIGVRDRVQFLPNLVFQDLLENFAACDIGMLLYPNNSFGNYFQQPGRLTEYMRAGVPVVASNFMGLENLVERYHLGAVADSQSPEAIAQAILEAGERSRADLAVERVRLRELARTEFAYETQAYRIEALVSMILGKGAHRPHKDEKCIPPNR